MDARELYHRKLEEDAGTTEHSIPLELMATAVLNHATLHARSAEEINTLVSQFEHDTKQFIDQHTTCLLPDALAVFVYICKTMTFAEIHLLITNARRPYIEPETTH